MIVSIALAVMDKDGIRSKEGDIICVRPAGWEWGTEERKRYLIVEVDLGNSITAIEDARKLEVPQLETGDLWWPDSVDKNGNSVEQPKIIGKRRHNIPFADLDSKAVIDWKKVTDQTVDYQPLEKLTIPFTNLILDKIAAKRLTDTDLTGINSIGK